MSERYVVKSKTGYGDYEETYETLDDALMEFLSHHIEGNKVQLTADVPKPKDEEDGWGF